MASDPEILLASVAQPTDAELEHLLSRVFLDGGFTDAALAQTLFAAPAVRARGELWVAWGKEHPKLIGMIVLVPPTSPARKLSGPTEAELHLLAVLPEFRGRGLGRRLVTSVIQSAREQEYSRLLLWSQPNMTAAHHLYRNVGFQRMPERDFRGNGRNFWVFRLDLSQ